MSRNRSFISYYFSKNALPFWCVLLLDCFLVSISLYFGIYLEVGGLVFALSFWRYTLGIVLLLLSYIFFFRKFHTYAGVVRYSSLEDLTKVVASSFWGFVTSVAIASIVNCFSPHYILFPKWTGFSALFFVSTTLMLLVRVVIKSLYDTTHSPEQVEKVFIYGVKEGAISLARSIKVKVFPQFSVVGFVSPNGDLESKYLMGVQVRRDGENLIQHMKDAGTDALIVSPLQVSHFREREDLINNLISNDIRIFMIPEAEEWDPQKELRQEQLHEVQIEDLLPREKIEVDMDSIGRLLSNNVILITGAAGSIGSEMVRQIAVYKPAELILIDQAEPPMHDIRLLMAREFSNIKSLTIVSSITNQEHMERIFKDHRPDYVFHAAAYKHVPMMEDNPGIAVQNNIWGTRVIADLAVKYGTRKFVMISTDKAVNPTNVMGCSKRICEIYCQSLNADIQKNPNKHLQFDAKPAITQFVTTRFGNVLGSNGSVIPIFKQQIAMGGPVTVTHPDIIRYFMLIPEACKLVLEAGTMGKGGEIFVFDMGKPVRIVDLAKRMISLSGVKNVQIKFSGLRDGEKLYEEVLSDQENTVPTVHPKIMIAKVREYDYEIAAKNEERLFEASFSFDDMSIVRIMKEIVPEYKSQVSKYQILDK